MVNQTTNNHITYKSKYCSFSVSLSLLSSNAYGAAKWCSAQNTICRSQKRKFASNRNWYRALASFWFHLICNAGCWRSSFLFSFFVWWLFGLRFCLLFNVVQCTELWRNKKRKMLCRWWCREYVYRNRYPSTATERFCFLVCAAKQKSIIRHQIQQRLRRLNDPMLEQCPYQCR